MEPAAIVDPGEFGEGGFRVGVEIEALLMERTAEENFGGEAGAIDALFGKEIGGLAEGLADGEARRLAGHRQTVP